MCSGFAGNWYKLFSLNEATRKQILERYVARYINHVTTQKDASSNSGNTSSNNLVGNSASALHSSGIHSSFSYNIFLACYTIFYPYIWKCFISTVIFIHSIHQLSGRRTLRDWRSKFSTWCSFRNTLNRTHTVRWSNSNGSSYSYHNNRFYAGFGRTANYNNTNIYCIRLGA